MTKSNWQVIVQDRDTGCPEHAPHQKKEIEKILYEVLTGNKCLENKLPEVHSEKEY